MPVAAAVWTSRLPNTRERLAQASTAAPVLTVFITCWRPTSPPTGATTSCTHKSTHGGDVYARGCYKARECVAVRLKVVRLPAGHFILDFGR
jgi:hypothetical protein